MTNENADYRQQKFCDLTYLKEMMGGKKELIAELMNDFLMEMPGEIQILNDAVAHKDCAQIKQAAHKMKSTVSVMGVAALHSCLNDMEQLAAQGNAEGPAFEKIILLRDEVNGICKKAIAETHTLIEEYK